MKSQVKTLMGVLGKKEKLILAFLLTFSIFIFGSTKTVFSGGPDKPMAQTPADIIDTAVAAGQFNTLASALKAAGLIETLKGPGPFTVFAPTDAAFAKLPAGTLEGLLKDKVKLQSVLTYHVVPGQVTAQEVVKLTEAKTVNGKSVKIQSSAKGVQVDQANVTKTDIMASNGVIHVIDTVLIP